MTIADVWTAEELMASTGKDGPDQDPMLWGVPGYLTKEQVDVYFQFKKEVESRGEEFRSTIYCFGEEEGEVWALCRWLRARKYALKEVLTMVEEATKTRQEPKEKNFYPNPVDALGCQASLFFAQYPQLYYGLAKNGALLFISKPGILNVDGMECITTLDGIIRFHWHVMMHDFSNRLRAEKAKNPNFKRFECFCILDLDHLTTSQLTRRALNIIKEQSAIDSICFPETMSKMLIINCPSFFPPTWRLIKGWLDPRTASKIEVISGKANSEKRLLELIDADQLPKDYGGQAKDTNTILMEDFGGTADRMSTHMLYLRGHGSHTVDVPSGETLEVTVYTRSTAGAIFSLHDIDKKQPIKEDLLVVDKGTTENHSAETHCTSLTADKPLLGPLSVKVKADSKASRLSMHHYLLVFTFKNK